MYNGIGLSTARGSGTNGFVQRNLSAVRKTKDRIDYRTEEDAIRLEKQLNRQPNVEILNHDRKRRVELKCMEMHELMEEQGYSVEDITQKVSMFRKMLMEKEGVTDSPLDKDEHGRPIAKETHQLAEANQEKNQRLREAFGLTDYVDGSAFDPNRKAKEEAAKATAMATKKYAIVQSSGSDEEEAQEEPPAKKKKKKSRGETGSPERREKRRKRKKHRHSRSESRKHRKSKKKHSKRRKRKNNSCVRSEEKSKKRSHRDSSSCESDSASQSDSNSRSDDSTADKKTKSPPALVNNKEKSTAIKSPPTVRHETSSDSDSARARKKTDTVLPEQSKAARNQVGSLGHSLADKNPLPSLARNHSHTVSNPPAAKISPPNHSHSNGQSKAADKKIEANTRPKSPVKLASPQSRNHISVPDTKSQRARSPRRSHSRSHSRSRRSRSIEKRRGHSRSHSKSYSRSHSRSYTRSRSRTSRSPSIRRRRGSPSHLDKRRITSARKRPVPYYRPSPPSSSSSEYSSHSRSRSGSRSRFRSLSRSPSLSFRRRRRPSPPILSSAAPQ